LQGQEGKDRTGGRGKTKRFEKAEVTKKVTRGRKNRRKNDSEGLKKGTSTQKKGHPEAGTHQLSD